MKKCKLYLLALYTLFQLYQCGPQVHYQCKPGETLVGNICEKCRDSECMVCRNNKINTCVKCNYGFYANNGVCGVKCELFDICDLCSLDLTECINCKNKCSVQDGRCSCTTKYVVIGVCVMIAIVIIVVVVFFLTKSALAIRLLITNINKKFGRNQITNRLPISPRLETAYLGTDIIPKIDVDVLYEQQFNENKIEVGDLNEKQLCSECSVQTANILLSCGCCLCYEHAKSVQESLEKTKECPVCHKDIENIKQMTCGICFQNKVELSKFSCKCSLIVCKDCFLHTKHSNQKCPACRAVI